MWLVLIKNSRGSGCFVLLQNFSPQQRFSGDDVMMSDTTKNRQEAVQRLEVFFSVVQGFDRYFCGSFRTLEIRSAGTSLRDELSVRTNASTRRTA